MKRTEGLLPRALAALSLIIGLLAVGAPAWSNNDQLRNEIRQFHAFLHDHPKVSTELRQNPKLVNSKRYLDKHDDLEKFLQRHPGVKRDIVSHPRRVFGNYDRADHARWQHR